MPYFDHGDALPLKTLSDCVSTSRNKTRLEIEDGILTYPLVSVLEHDILTYQVSWYVFLLKALVHETRTRTKEWMALLTVLETTTRYHAEPFLCRLAHGVRVRARPMVWPRSIVVPAAGRGGGRG